MTAGPPAVDDHVQTLRPACQEQQRRPINFQRISVAFLTIGSAFPASEPSNRSRLARERPVTWSTAQHWTGRQGGTEADCREGPDNDGSERRRRRRRRLHLDTRSDGVCRRPRASPGVGRHRYMIISHSSRTTPVSGVINVASGVFATGRPHVSSAGDRVT